METSRYWPFSVRWAFIASLIMVPTLVALAVWLYRPAGPLATRLTFAPLLVAVLLGLLPVVLVILGGVRSVEAAGVTVAFAAVQDVVSTRGVITARSLIADNLGSAPGSVMDSGSDTIIDSLKDAVGNYSVVADLKEGEEWWETRLLVLVSGAVRLAFPKAVVFTVATPDQPRCFLGWATPGELLRRLLAGDPALRDAYRAAQRDWMLWQLGDREQPGAQRLLPWAPGGKAHMYLAPAAPLPELAKRLENDMVELAWPSTVQQATPWVMREDGFEAERLLLSRLSPLEVSDAPRSLTRGRQFVNLVPRRTALNAVLLALISGSKRSSGPGSQRSDERRRSG